MVSGFFLGGLASGFGKQEAINNQANYEQGLLQLAQQREKNLEQQQQRAEYMQLRSDGISHIEETIKQLKIAHPDWGPMQLASNPAIVSQKNMLAQFSQNLGIPNDLDSIVAQFAERPSETSVKRAEAAATGELAKTQAQTVEANARAGYYDRGGMPQPSNPDLDTGTQLGGPKSDETILNGLSKSAGMTSESLDVAGRSLAAGNTSVLQNLGRGKQGGEAVKAVRAWAAYTLMHEDHLTAKQAADQLNYNALNYKGQSAAETTLGRRSAQFSLAENEFEQTSGLVLDASKNVPRSEFKTLNELMLAWREGAGDPAVVQLGAAINSAVNVYARAINPTGQATVSDKDHAREILQKAWSDGQINAGIEQLRKEVAAAKKSIPAAKQELRGGGNSAAPSGKVLGTYNKDTGEFE